MYNEEKWSRVSLEDDFFDVKESYDDVMSLLNEGGNFIELTGIGGNKISVRPRCVQAVYETGMENLVAIWLHNKEMEDARKNTIGWDSD